MAIPTTAWVLFHAFLTTCCGSYVWHDHAQQLCVDLEIGHENISFDVNVFCMGGVVHDSGTHSHTPFSEMKTL